MNEFISRYLFYPSWELFSSRNAFSFYSSLKKLEKSQWLSKKNLEELQNKKLRHLICYAYENVPYYRRLFDRMGIKPEQIKDKNDLQKIPVLTKDIIRKNFNKLLSKTYTPKEYWIEFTGGSTGEPLRFFRDKKTHEYLLASERRFWRWAGYDIGTKFFQLWSSPYDLKKSESVRTKLHRFLINHRMINTFDMSKKELKNYIEEFQHIKPKIVHGYVSSVCEFARYIQQKNIQIPQPKAVITTSEMLSDSQRELIEKIFNCKVFQEYGCREMGIIAHECKNHKGYHVCDEKIILEICKKGIPVEDNNPGEVTLTDLNNFAMPFIRYQNGDLAVSTENETCSCGRNLSMIKKIEGRVTDFLIGENKKMVAGVAITTYFSKIENIKEFQFIQNQKDKVIINIIKGERFSEKTIQDIHDFASRYLGRSIRVSIRYPKKIKLTKSGKKKAIICNIAKDSNH